jgi:hypothetical protein
MMLIGGGPQCYPSYRDIARATALDSHFDDISMEPINAHENHSGRAFVDYSVRSFYRYLEPLPRRKAIWPRAYDSL